MVALYFAAFPMEAEQLRREIEEYDELQEVRRESLEFTLKEEYIPSMSRKELEDELYDLLVEGPDWQFDQFIQEHLPEYGEFL